MNNIILGNNLLHQLKTKHLVQEAINFIVGFFNLLLKVKIKLSYLVWLKTLSSVIFSSYETEIYGSGPTPASDISNTS